MPLHRPGSPSYCRGTGVWGFRDGLAAGERRVCSCTGGVSPGEKTAGAG